MKGETFFTVLLLVCLIVAAGSAAFASANKTSGRTDYQHFYRRYGIDEIMAEIHQRHRDKGELLEYVFRRSAYKASVPPTGKFWPMPGSVGASIVM